MSNEAEQAIYQRLSSAPLFHPASVELLPEDWGIETGDVVSVKSGDETYNVPVYSHTLVWNGKSKATIESTGHQQREPLPELKRKEYKQGHAMYSGFKAQQEEIDEHYQHLVEVTDKGMSDAFGIIGVSIDPETGMPKVDETTGEYIWKEDDPDASATYGEIWGHLNRDAWVTEILHNVADQSGNVLSMAEVDVDGHGDILIQALNTQGTGQVKISANVIDVEGLLSAPEFQSWDAYILAVHASRISADSQLDVGNDAQFYCYGTARFNAPAYFTNYFSVGGAGASWNTATFVSGITATPQFTVKDTGGTNRTGRLITDVATATISYLGSGSSGGGSQGGGGNVG